ncbi:MAG: hypothetical protein Salg2KO_13690 [Salibacteraceae bacterium]
MTDMFARWQNYIDLFDYQLSPHLCELITFYGEYLFKTLPFQAHIAWIHIALYVNHAIANCNKDLFSWIFHNY